MTRETKIGLLVGLAFIILFGIILSEKGTSRNSEFATPPITAIKPLVELVPPTAPAPKITRIEDRTVPTKIKVTMNDSADASESPKTKLIDVDNTVVEKIIEPGPSNMIIKETPTPEIREQIATPKLAPKLKKMLPQTPTRGLSQIPASKPTPKTTVAEDQPIAAVAQVDKVEIKKVQKVRLAQKTTETDNQFTKHEVAPGETLAGICRKYYPGQAYNMVKTVMAVNKISDPKKLRSGQTLEMPPLSERLASTASSVDTTKETTKTTSSLKNNPLLKPVNNTTLASVVKPDSSKINLEVKAPARSKAVQTYTVQDKDTLTKIAKRFYGSERAWTKIYEMNKKILKSPHAIRSGISLKLPAGELAVGPKVD